MIKNHLPHQRDRFDKSSHGSAESHLHDEEARVCSDSPDCSQLGSRQGCKHLEEDSQKKNYLMFLMLTKDLQCSAMVVLQN